MKVLYCIVNLSIINFKGQVSVIFPSVLIQRQRVPKRPGLLPIGSAGTPIISAVFDI